MSDYTDYRQAQMGYDKDDIIKALEEENEKLKRDLTEHNKDNFFLQKENKELKKALDEVGLWAKFARDIINPRQEEKIKFMVYHYRIKEQGGEV